jgi:beta-xylosidase
MKIRVAFSFLVLAVALSVLVLTAVAEPSAPAGGWADGFDIPTLDSRWFWVNEDPSHWSLTERPGFMRITAQEGGKNVLLQAAPADDYVIETRLLFEPTQNIQRAGLFIFQDWDNSLALIRAYCDYGPPSCPGNAIYFDHVEAGQGVGSNFATTTPYTSDTYLRIVRQGQEYTGYVSEDDVHWTLIGTHVTEADFAPTAIGLRADYASLGAGEIPADFDHFRLNLLTELVMLPFIAR